MVQTTPDHPLTSSMGKRSTKLNESSHTDKLVEGNGCNISSNGKGTLKATTHGNQLIKFMPLNLSSIINPQEPISHPQPILTYKPSMLHPIPLLNAQRSSPLSYQMPSKRLPH